MYIYIILKLGFERYGGNCPSWEGNCPGELSGGEMSLPPTTKPTSPDLLLSPSLSLPSLSGN